MENSYFCIANHTFISMKYLYSFLASMMLLVTTSVVSRAYTVVFMGDSITEVWLRDHAPFFNSNSYLGKGISGQTTAQMIKRFQSDVINYKPKVVVILAGCNDIAQNKGYVAYEEVAENIMRMAELATAAGAKVAIVSLLPTDYFFWNTALKPAKQIRTMNSILEERVLDAGYTWVDMYSALVVKDGAIDDNAAYDRLHPSVGGMEMMEQIIQPYLEELL